MERGSTQSSEVLLARVNHELERISELQHRLARTKAVLKEQATRLRLGVAPAEVGVILDTLATEREAEPSPEPEWAPAEHGARRLLREAAARTT